MFRLLLVVAVSIFTLELTEQVAAECSDGEFECISGDCIPASWECDQYADCPGNEQEDEEDCENREPCSPFEFQCNNGVCIIGYQKCDGYPNCKDKEDEECGPLCLQCDGWYTLRNYPIDCGQYGRYPQSCEDDHTCVTHLRQRKNGKIKAWFGCKRKSWCQRLQSLNDPGCYETPIQVNNEKGCTFCCEDNSFCNDQPLTKRDVIAV